LLHKKKNRIKPVFFISVGKAVKKGNLVIEPFIETLKLCNCMKNNANVAFQKNRNKKT